jgi:hypothetical protein
MTTYALEKLTVDEALYPRARLNPARVSDLVEALEAGAQLPPLLVEKKTLRIVDGRHRFEAYRRLYGLDHKVEVEEKVYASEAKLFLDAMRLNAVHGLALGPGDRIHSALTAEALGITMAQLAQALSLTLETAQELSTARVGRLSSPHAPGGAGGERRVVLKPALAHLAGHELSEAEREINDKLAGGSQGYMLYQVRLLLEADLLDLADAQVKRELAEICRLLAARGYFAPVPPEMPAAAA